MDKIFEILANILTVFLGGKKKEEPVEVIKVGTKTSEEWCDSDNVREEPEEEKSVKNRQDRLVYQTELDDERLRKYGCAFRCYQAVGELTCNEFLTKEEIEDLGKKAFEKGYLTGNAEVEKPEDLARQVLELFGKEKEYRIYNSGYKKDGKAYDWSNKETNNYDYIITKLIQKNKKDNHFVLCGKNSKMIFDPTPNSISAQLWNVETEYLYKVKKLV